MSEIRIEPLRADQHADVARMLARAFVTNPLHVAAFGPNQLEKNEAFFRIGLALMKGPKHVAIEATEILGVIHWVHAPRCQVSTGEKVRMLPAMIGGFGLGSSLHVGSWLSAWSKHDPSEPHLHLGPVGVSPSAQGRGIGRQLMQRYCGELDRGAQAGYLETDRPENVTFYRRFGFEVTAEIPVLGVRNFLMRRAVASR